MAVVLQGIARLTPRRDAAAMANALLWVAGHQQEARAQALLGREVVLREWSREKAFADLGRVLDEVCSQPRRQAA
jgi:hypothetical protein